MSSPAEVVADNGPRLVTHAQVQSLYGVAGAFLALAVIAIVCRALALYIRRSWGRWDDWTMFFCIMPTAALAAMMCVQGKRVYGGPKGGDPYLWLQRILIDTWTVQILTITSLYVFKLSICIRYLRIAGDTTDWFWRLSMLLIIILSAHYISSLVVWALQCIPTHRYWDLGASGTCISQPAWTLSVNGVNLVTDVLVLILPMRPVLKLKMPVKQRLAILAIFMFGGLSTVAGCLRFFHLYTFYEGTSDIGRKTLEIEIWAFVEISLGISCGCMPSFRTLYTSFRSALRSQDSWNSMDNQTLTGNNSGRSSTTKHSCLLSRKTLSDGVDADGVDDVELTHQLAFDQENSERVGLPADTRLERHHQVGE